MKNKQDFDDATPEVITNVDGKLRHSIIRTRWFSRMISNNTREITFMDAGRPVEKTLGLSVAKDFVVVLQKQIDFYESDYFKWGQRKAGNK